MSSGYYHASFNIQIYSIHTKKSQEYFCGLQDFLIENVDITANAGKKPQI